MSTKHNNIDFASQKKQAVGELRETRRKYSRKKKRTTKQVRIEKERYIVLVKESKEQKVTLSKLFDFIIDFYLRPFIKTYSEEKRREQKMLEAFKETKIR